MILLDTTPLSNFAHIGRLDLLRLALPQAATTPHVVAELEKGVASGRLPAFDWEWLDVVELTPTEETNLADVRMVLGDGEASCIAVALERKAGVFTDDLDARHYARRRGIRVSGTLGVLSLLVERRCLTMTQADVCLQEMIDRGFRSPVRSLTNLSATTRP